jgi:hypothetical protein
MSLPDDPLEAIISRLGFTHCPACHVRITPATVQVGWNPASADDAVFPIAWLTCTHNRCATQLHRALVTLPEGRFAQSQEEAMAALLGSQ